MDLLLAEDDDVSQTFLAEVLGSAGHHVCHAADGQIALELALARPFDRLLLDLNLPRLRGDALLARLRGSGGASATAPALALTADDDPQRHRRLLSAGFAAVVIKPVSRHVLLGHVDGRAVRSDPPATASGNFRPGVLDDTAALAATAGNPDMVWALRGLLAKELPVQRQRIELAISDGRHTCAQGELHRLRAACGFCGAVGLALEARQFEQALACGLPPAAALSRFAGACDALLAALERSTQDSPATSG